MAISSKGRISVHGAAAYPEPLQILWTMMVSVIAKHIVRDCWLNIAVSGLRPQLQHKFSLGIIGEISADDRQQLPAQRRKASGLNRVQTATLVGDVVGTDAAMLCDVHDDPLAASRRRSVRWQAV